MPSITSVQATSYETEPTIVDDTVNLNNYSDSFSKIKLEINNGIKTVKENIENGFSGDIATLEKVLQLLNSPEVLEDELKILNKQTKGNKSCYTVTFNSNNKLFTITNIVGETRFPTATTSGDDFIITLKDGFDELYNQLFAPSYDVIEEPATPTDTSTYVLV